jgi:Uma2 family endonuclease
MRRETTMYNAPDAAGAFLRSARHLRRPRAPAAGGRRLPDTPYFELAPDWVCEVLSSSTALLERARKLAIYARAGGCWMILGVHAGQDVVRAEPFAAVPLDLGALWAD